MTRFAILTLLIFFTLAPPAFAQPGCDPDFGPCQPVCDPDLGPCQPGTVAPDGSTNTGTGSGSDSGSLNNNGSNTGSDSGGLNNPSGGSNITLINPLGSSGGSLDQFLKSILRFVIRIGAIVVVVMLVYVGFLFVAARGNSTKLEDARRALLWTVIGALILLGAEAIRVAIQATVQALSIGQ